MGEVQELRQDALRNGGGVAPGCRCARPAAPASPKWLEESNLSSPSDRPWPSARRARADDLVSPA